MKSEVEVLEIYNMYVRNKKNYDKKLRKSRKDGHKTNIKTFRGKALRYDAMIKCLRYILEIEEKKDNLK